MLQIHHCPVSQGSPAGLGAGALQGGLASAAGRRGAPWGCSQGMVRGRWTLHLWVLSVTALHHLHPGQAPGSPCWAGAEPRAATVPAFHPQSPCIPQSPRKDASPSRPTAGCAGDQRWVLLLSPHPAPRQRSHPAPRQANTPSSLPHRTPLRSHPPLEALQCCPKPLRLLLLLVGKVKKKKY